jgi:hypothetical protein
MKTRLSRHYRFTILATVAAMGACAPALRADWGSIRSNNHTQPAHEVQRGHVEVEHGRTVVEHGHVEVAHGHPEPARVVEPRHANIEAERRHGYYWSGYRPGLTLGALPAGYVQVSFGGTGYYYYDGVYFRPTPGGPYAVVMPPVGVIVPQLPEGPELVVTGQGTYYYAGGAFYLPAPAGFAVVPAPLGATVSALPPDATPIVINGRAYYVSNGTYFLPVMMGGATVYTTVRP